MQEFLTKLREAEVVLDGTDLEPSRKDVLKVSLQSLFREAQHYAVNTHAPGATEVVGGATIMHRPDLAAEQARQQSDVPFGDRRPNEQRADAALHPDNALRK